MIFGAKSVNARTAVLRAPLQASGVMQARRGRVMGKVVCEDAPEKKSAKKAKAVTLRSEFATQESIQQEVEKLRAEMFTMRIKFAKREEYQPAQYKALRKRVAQLLTIQRERTVAEGVSRREAQALERRQKQEAGLRQF
eukprot:jgi/Picsp_1/2477/NSC_00710-R1_50s ribosomal protein l29